MSFTNADLLAIKAELTNDPKALGLTLLAADDESNANKLNEVSALTPIDREAIPVSEVVLSVDSDEFLALSEGQQRYLLFITNAGVVNPKSGNEVREALLQYFSAQSETRGKLLTLVTEPASRITQLFKLGTLSQGVAVTPSDVANARNAV